EVVEVEAAKRLHSHAACFSTDGPIAIVMEETMQQKPDRQGVKDNKVFEINRDDEVFDSLKSAVDQDEEKFALYTKLLFSQAMIMEGLPIEDPVAFSNDICKVMV